MFKLHFVFSMASEFHYFFNLRIYASPERYLILTTHCILSNEIRDQTKADNQHGRAPSPSQNDGNVDVVTGDVEIGFYVSSRFHDPNPDPECCTQQTNKSIHMQMAACTQGIGAAPCKTKQWNAKSLQTISLCNLTKSTP